MTAPAVRPELVELLLDVDMDRTRHPRTWTRHDGRPLGPADLALIATASDAELGAFAAVSAAAAAAEDAQLDLIEELLDLVDPFLADLPAGAGLDDVAPLLDAEQRAAYERLVGALLAGEPSGPAGCACPPQGCRTAAPGPVPVELGAPR